MKSGFRPLEIASQSISPIFGCPNLLITEHLQEWNQSRLENGCCYRTRPLVYSFVFKSPATTKERNTSKNEFIKPSWKTQSRKPRSSHELKSTDQRSFQASQSNQRILRRWHPCISFNLAQSERRHPHGLRKFIGRK